MEIFSCELRGKYYYPAATQPQYIDDDGVLNLSVDYNFLFDLQVPIDCTEGADRTSFTYSGTAFDGSSPRGWYILFTPEENDSGANYNKIVVTYDDKKTSNTTIPPVSSSRIITIQAVNDVPTISIPDILTGGRVNIYGDQPEIVVPTKKPQNFGLRVGDVDAILSDGSEFSGMSFRVHVTKYVTKDGTVTTAPIFITYTDSSEPIVEKTSFDVIQIPRVSLSEANFIFQTLAFQFDSEGTYTIEVIAVDGGQVGYCPPGLVPDTTAYDTSDIRFEQANGTLIVIDDVASPSHCNTVAVVKFTVTASANTLVTAGAATAGGAAAAALLAVGAVIFAKLKKPEDLDAWQALDGAMGGNTMSSGIHVTAGTSGKSALYTGK